MTEFFAVFGDSTVHLMSGRGVPEQLTVEELYLAFRERLIADLVVSAPDLTTLGVLQAHPSAPHPLTGVPHQCTPNPSSKT